MDTIKRSVAEKADCEEGRRMAKRLRRGVGSMPGAAMRGSRVADSRGLTAGLGSSLMDTG